MFSVHVHSSEVSKTGNECNLCSKPKQTLSRESSLTETNCQYVDFEISTIETQWSDDSEWLTRF